MVEQLTYKLRKKDLPALRRIYNSPIRGKRKIGAFLCSLKGKLFAVGDVAASDALAIGVAPWSIVYDRKSCRRAISAARAKLIDDWRIRRVRVSNPAGVITSSLLRACKIGIRKRLKIEVDGEEDLAALVFGAVAPIGSVVVYGLRGKGLTWFEVTPQTRKTWKGVLRK